MTAPSTPDASPAGDGPSASPAPIQPGLDEFRRLARERRVIGVHRRLIADAETAIGLYQKLAGNRPGTFLLESAEHTGVWARYSFIGVRSAATLTERDGQAHWTGTPPAGLPTSGDPLTALRHTLDRLHTPPDPAMPPFTSGLVGYLGYDAVRRIELLPDTNPDETLVPELGFLLASDVAVLDHQAGEVWLIANAINFDDSDERVDDAHADAVRRVEQMTEEVARPTPSTVTTSDQEHRLPVRRQRSESEYRRAVQDAVAQIEAGEAFQIVVSQRFEVATSADALDVYRVLRLSNPSPYLYLLRMDGFDIVGSSPEALVTVTDRKVVAHPIAGSKPRGHDERSDQELETELRSDEKERAEHLMLVDLGRNDLGRVCEPGSVEVVEFAQVRRYSHIMHLESTVTGRLAEQYNALDAILASFPAGTLSGAPKVRAMEVIDKLEVSRRGLYGGVVGYLDFAGEADAAIAIRTALLRDGIGYVQAGGGVVADSVPASEDAESQNKAAAIIRAISIAETFQPASANGQPR